jgi:hypothetical protein
VATGSHEPPPELGRRGRRLWEQATADGELTPGHVVLLEEACRCADRLDDLDKLLRDVSDMSGMDSEDSGGRDGALRLVTGLLAEARAQQTALRGIVAELRQGQRAAGGGKSPAAAPDTTAGGSNVSDLSARIESRRNQAQG